MRGKRREGWRERRREGEEGERNKGGKEDLPRPAVSPLRWSPSFPQCCHTCCPPTSEQEGALSGRPGRQSDGRKERMEARRERER